MKILLEHFALTALPASLTVAASAAICTSPGGIIPDNPPPTSLTVTYEATA